MAGWLSNTVNPVNDGAILPIFYLNGGKILATIFERKTDEELTLFFEGLGWETYFC